MLAAVTKFHSTKKPVTTMLTYPWKCTALHCNHLGNTWKPLVLMTRHFDYCPSASEGDNQSVRSSAPVVSRCFPGGYNVKLYISRGRLAWFLLVFLHSVCQSSKLVCKIIWANLCAACIAFAGGKGQGDNVTSANTGMSKTGSSHATATLLIVRQLSTVKCFDKVPNSNAS